MCDDGSTVFGGNGDGAHAKYMKVPAHTLVPLPDEFMNRKQLTVMGSWTFSKNGQADCARFIADRKIDVDGLFTHSWPLEDAVSAYELFDTQTTGKGVLVPS